MNTIHWLGAGLSSIPGIRRCAASSHPFVLWNRTLEKAEAALDGQGEARELNGTELESAVQAGDVVVSMLPADQHQRVAEMCLEAGAHFISSSYLTPAMLELHDAVRDKGLCFVGEVGLDPGIDHLMAHALVGDYKASGCMDPSLEHRFQSYCGGFPSQPNDFRYKFSWSPLGVLRALKTPAVWIADGTEQAADTPWKVLQDYVAELPGGAEVFQAYPNRDSLPFLGTYGFDSSFNMIEFVRGTLRLDGWAEAWQDLFVTLDSDTTGDDELRALSDALWRAHAYAPGEADRVVLEVRLKVRDGRKTVWDGAWSLDETGRAEGSAMARLVSNTVSIAVEAVVNRELPPGVSGAPSDPARAKSWLAKLVESGEDIVRS